MDKNELRKAIKLKRNNMTRNDRINANKIILEKFITSEIFNNSQTIACYFSQSHELCTQKIIEEIWNHGKDCYMPCLAEIDNNPYMNFKIYDKNTQLKDNKFGIPEPVNITLPTHNDLTNNSMSTYNNNLENKNEEDVNVYNQYIINPLELDCVIMPLVAVDDYGHRLGMGSGYYDRTFAGAINIEQRPTFIGLAYPYQIVESIPHDKWDVDIDIIITT